MNKLLLIIATLTSLFALSSSASACNGCCGGGCGAVTVYYSESGAYVETAPYYNGGPFTGLEPTYGLYRCARVEGRYNYYGFWVPTHRVCWND